MNNDTLQEKIKNTPEEIKAVLSGSFWSLVIDQISRNNNFSEEQRVLLENEALFVLLGMELAKDLKQNIRQNLGLDELVSQNIANEIYEKIFKNVEDFLPTETEQEEAVQDELAPLSTSETLPEIPPEDLPSIIPGMGAEIRKPPTANPEGKQISYGVGNQQPTANQESVKPTQGVTAYPSGQDPYREPIE
ncbi:MAG: hypothetical protein AAB690_02700 [Patescibacteria group bacterium]